MKYARRRRHVVAPRPQCGLRHTRFQASATARRLATVAATRSVRWVREDVRSSWTI
jgi:hypothetical protein